MIYSPTTRKRRDGRLRGTGTVRGYALLSDRGILVSSFLLAGWNWNWQLATGNLLAVAESRPSRAKEVGRSQSLNRAKLITALHPQCHRPEPTWRCIATLLASSCWVSAVVAAHGPGISLASSGRSKWSLYGGRRGYDDPRRMWAGCGAALLAGTTMLATVCLDCALAGPPDSQNSPLLSTAL